MNTIDIYSDYLSKLLTALQADDKDTIDYLLEYAASWELEQDDLDALEEVISEATLYIELGEQEYREMAMKLIGELEEK